MKKILAIFAKNTIKTYYPGIIYFNDGAIYLFDAWLFEAKDTGNDITVTEKEEK